METKPNNKSEHQSQCRQLADQYFKNNGMFVVYIRQRQPKFLCEVSEEDRTEIIRLLDLIPGLNERNYENFVETTNEGGQPAPTLESFLTVRSVIRAKTSPLRGVVVAFRDGKNLMIGWSLCNKKDSFDQYDGIRRAIRRAEPIAAIKKKCDLTTSAMQSAGYIGPDVGLLPHSCLPTIGRVIQRAEKKFSK